MPFKSILVFEHNCGCYNHVQYAKEVNACSVDRNECADKQLECEEIWLEEREVSLFMYSACSQFEPVKSLGCHYYKVTVTTGECGLAFYWYKINDLHFAFMACTQSYLLKLFFPLSL